MAKRQKMEAWEEQLINEAAAISTFHRVVGMPSVMGKKISQTRHNDRKTQVATVRNRDNAACHMGFAPDRKWG